MIQNYDVIVVGAGPAGSFTAKKLAEKKHKVLLIDKMTFPRPKTCAGGLMAHALRDFPEVHQYIDSAIHHVKVISPNLKYDFEVSGETPLMSTTRGRKDFDYQLLLAAENAGVKTLLGQKVSKIILDYSGVRVELEGGTSYLGKYLVGADGAYSFVAQELNLGLSQQRDKVGLGIEQEFPITLPESLRKVELFLNFDGITGYGWVFPRQNSVNIGLGGLLHQGRQLKKSFQNFIHHLQEMKILPNELPEISPSGAILPIFYPPKEIVGYRTLLVGDAGGFCSAATGEGIYYALKSGDYAAQTLHDAIKSSSFDRPGNIHSYLTLTRKLRSELHFHYFIQKFVFQDLRRTNKAIAWGSQDQKLREIFAHFLMGNEIRYLKLKMAYHYARCKLKEIFGWFEIDEELKKKNYKKSQRIQ